MSVGVGLLGRGGEAPREVGGKGELVHSRAGLGMAVEEFFFSVGEVRGYIRVFSVEEYRLQSVNADGILHAIHPQSKHFC